jgi:hypothetical protein
MKTLGYDPWDKIAMQRLARHIISQEALAGTLSLGGHSFAERWRIGWSFLNHLQSLFLKNLGYAPMIEAHGLNKFGRLGVLWDEQRDLWGFSLMEALKESTTRFPTYQEDAISPKKIQGLTQFWLGCSVLQKLALSLPEAQEVEFLRRLDLFPEEEIQRRLRAQPLLWGTEDEAQKALAMIRSTYA